ncbi:MGMT family protein [Desulfosediminicola sp.]|uniref:MGMT family protein n=1 Tax=Desulfosediminicola sp. TaxID=2886825 RepID=UPI003AF203C4
MNPSVRHGDMSYRSLSHSSSPTQMPSLFTQRVIELISRIPKGKVTTYGSIARLAGNSGGARQVSRILHSSSKKFHLPWHRVVNKEGKISLPKGRGYEEQRALLIHEGVKFNKRHIDLDRYLWTPEQGENVIFPLSPDYDDMDFK